MMGEKIDGFRFAFGYPIMPNFMINGKYELIGPQPPRQGGMQGQMMGPGQKKQSQFNLMMQYYSERVMRPGILPWVFMSQSDSSGKQLCLLSKNFNQNLAVALQAHLATKEMCEANVQVMYNTDTWNGSLMIGNMAKEVSYVQSIGDTTQIGLSLTDMVIFFSFEISRI